MADNLQPLITLGPFGGLDTTTLDLYKAPTDAYVASNCEQQRALKGLVTAKGRAVAYLWQNDTANNPSLIGVYYPYSTDVCYVRQSTAKMVVYDSFYGGEYQPANYNAVYPANQVVQFGDTLFFNNGTQLRGTAAPGASQLPVVTSWQYLAPTQGFSVTASSYSPYLPLNPNTGGPNTYAYAITRVYAGSPNGNNGGYFNGVFSQETTPLGNNYPFAYALAVSNSTTSATITTNGSYPFGGADPAGIPYTTNIYRWSNDLPVWTLLASGVTGTSYIDTATSTSIAANAQLIPDRDPPPNGQSNLAPIASWKERMWSFSLMPTSRTSGNAPWQCQLWYSNIGRPWEFDQVNQVLLVGSSTISNRIGGYNPLFPNVPVVVNYTGGDDYPVALLPFESIMLCFKRRSVFYVSGDTSSDFRVLPLFNVGLVGPRACVVGRNVACWLSEEGVMTYDGSSLQLISEKVRATINAIPLSDQQNAVMFYSRRTLYLSFPATGITLCCYVPTQDWFSLPYATNTAVSIPSLPDNSNTIFGDVLANRLANGSSYLDAWFSGGENDLGNPVLATWTSPISDAGDPSHQKVFSYLLVEAPVQQVSLTLTLTIDPNTSTAVSFTTPAISLGTGETRHLVAIPNRPKGYLAQLSVNFQSSGTADTVVYRAAVYGYADRNLVVPQ